MELEWYRLVLMEHMRIRMIGYVVKEGAFKHAIDAVQNLVAEGIPVGIAFTPTQKNINEIDEAIVLANSIGVSSFKVQPIMALGRAACIIDYFPSDIDYMKLSRKINKIKYEGKYPKLAFEWGDPLEHIFAIRSNFRNKSIIINAYGN